MGLSFKGESFFKFFAVFKYSCMDGIGFLIVAESGFSSSFKGESLSIRSLEIIKSILKNLILNSLNLLSQHT